MKTTSTIPNTPMFIKEMYKQANLTPSQTSIPHYYATYYYAIGLLAIVDDGKIPSAGITIEDASSTEVITKE